MSEWARNRTSKDDLCMTFLFRELKTLPLLAWCARIIPGRPTVEVWHGSWVEVRTDGFVEGAWDGMFSEYRFDEARTFAGTGAVTTNDGIMFVSGTDLQARLFSTQQDGVICVSNSLPFVMAGSGNRLSDRFGYYSGEFLYQCVLGIHRNRRSLPMHHGSVDCHECVNLEIRPGRPPRRLKKRATSPPRNYAEHIETLNDAIGRTITNATDGTRIHPFEPVVTLSRGYDSVMVAAIASTRGCKEALTFVDPPRPDAPPAEDGGTAIGEKLGMTVKEFDHFEFHQHGTPDEAEFCAYPPAIDYPLATLEKNLKGRMLMTGSFGDCILSKYAGDAQPDFRQSTFQGLCGSTMTEFRLRVGCINFPPLFINGLHVEAVRRISCSEEMAPWSVGGKYDRPIARRCAVEAGVPSEWFGTRKYGSGWGLIKNVSELSAASQDDFRAYLASVENPSGPVHSRFSWRLVQVYMRLLRLFNMNTKKMKYIPRSMKRFTRPPLEDQLFRWGINRTMRRYDDAFKSD